MSCKLAGNTLLLLVSRALLTRQRFRLWYQQILEIFLEFCVCLCDCCRELDCSREHDAALWGEIRDETANQVGNVDTDVNEHVKHVESRHVNGN
jgi:hypothetical protein